MRRRNAVIALASGGAGLALIGYSLRRGASLPKRVEPPRSGGRQPLPLRSDVGTLPEHEKQLLWQLAVATGALWGLTDLSRIEVEGFLDLKTQSPPSYLAEYRNALELFATVSRDHAPPEAVATILRRAARDPAAERARRFVIGELIALHLASGGFRQFGLTRFRGFIGEGFRPSTLQPGRTR